MPQRPVPPRQKRLVVIEEGLLQSMALNPQFTARFPFLAALQSPLAKLQAGKCPRCGPKAQARKRMFEAAKAAIATLDNEGKLALKALLHAQEIRVRFLEGNRTVEKTI